MILDRNGGQYSSKRKLIDVPQVPTAYLRAASPYLLNAMGAPQIPGCTDATQQPWAPGVRQPFPLTAVDLIKALGATGVIAPASVLAIYDCSQNPGPLTDALGLGPNLVAAGGPLTGRECCGLPDTTFVSKVGCENIASNTRFADAAAVFGDVVAGTFGFAAVVRIRENSAAASKVLEKRQVAAPTTGWMLAIGAGGFQIYTVDNTGAVVNTAGLGVDSRDSSWHCVMGYLNGTTRGIRVFSDIGDSAEVIYANPITGAGNFAIGAPSDSTSALCQVAYLACFDVEITSAQRATFWRHALSAGLGTPNTYTRANPLVVPITASRVACYGAGQLAVGYDAGLVSAALGNALGTGVVAEDGATFEPIGSDDIATLTDNNTTHAANDGPSGMRDGVRVTMNGAAWGLGLGYAYKPAAGVAIAGASNVPWRLDGDYKRATVNTTARTGLFFTGSAGGNEFFTVVADAATPVDWTRNGGSVTPVNADQTAVFLLLGAAANGDNCDHAELALIKNRTTASLAWRRVGTAAAAATSTPTLSMTNTGNRRYSPIRGTIELEVSGFQLTNGATFLQIGAAAAAGSATLDYSAGQLRLRWYDNTPALTATVLCGPLDATRWKLRISYDHAYPVPNYAGCYIVVERINAGASPTVLGTWLAGWTIPTADVTPISVGTDAAGANSARCFISLA